MALDWGTVPSWATAITALVGATLAIRQLGLARQAQEQQVQIARANLILSIDAEFEGSEIYGSRKAIRSLRNRVEKTVDGSVKDRSPDALRKASAEEFSHQMNELWKKARLIIEEESGASADQIRDANNQYTELMILPNWIETVAMLCRRNLLPTADVLDIYDQVVITTMSNFKSHIEARRVEGPFQNPRFLENALWLLDEATSYSATQGEPRPTPPKRSNTRW
jgi:hypothetical protein